MKKYRFMLMAVCGLALSASASGQCPSFRPLVPIEIGEDAPGNLDPSPACVALGGQVYWVLDDKSSGEVTFSDNRSPLDPFELKPVADGTYYKVLATLPDPKANTFTYQ